jgi:ribonuclease BN (tRNA processing enzyme)
MKIRILGCSGGIGGTNRTTSMLVDSDVLIDAGTGVGDLSFEEMCRIDHVFLTHSHLDHIACLPLLVDSVGIQRNTPVTVHALPQTIDALKRHIFNYEIWPDFTSIPNSQQPFMRYETIALERTVTIAGREITPLPASHTVPAVGYQIDSGSGSLVFSGDTTENDSFWQAVNQIDNLRFLLIETAFCNRERHIAVASKHLCPDMLAAELGKLTRTPEIFITHLKPGESELTMQEIESGAAAYRPKMLCNNNVFEI